MQLGRLASEQVIIQLLKQERLPILSYGLEVCNLDKCTLQSLDFTINRFFMKIFKTSNTVKHCQYTFDCKLATDNALREIQWIVIYLA